MPNPLLTKVVAKQLRQVPEFRPGDTIRVHVKIKEGDKERLQAFEGTVIARNNSGSAKPSPCERSASARVWSAFSPSTPR